MFIDDTFITIFLVFLHKKGLFILIQQLFLVIERTFCKILCWMRLHRHPVGIEHTWRNCSLNGAFCATVIAFWMAGYFAHLVVNRTHFRSRAIAPLLKPRVPVALIRDNWLPTPHRYHSSLGLLISILFSDSTKKLLLILIELLEHSHLIYLTVLLLFWQGCFSDRCMMKVA